MSEHKHEQKQIPFGPVLPPAMAQARELKEARERKEAKARATSAFAQGEAKTRASGGEANGRASPEGEEDMKAFVGNFLTALARDGVLGHIRFAIFAPSDTDPSGETMTLGGGFIEDVNASPPQPAIDITSPINNLPSTAPCA
jgi:hypothetical protein